MENLPIRKIIDKIGSGEIRIPSFQRGFVWEPDAVAFLMDSLFKGYPIGAVLLWRTKEQLVNERQLGCFTLPNPAKDYPVDYVLDGQQRLTSIFSVFQTELSPEDNPNWKDIYYIIGKGQQFQETQFVPLSPDEVDLAKHFPLSVLFDSVKYRRATETLDDDTKQEIDKLQEIFKEVTKTFIAMLASNGPRSFISGANVDLSVTLKQASSKEFHHIFPDKFLQRSGKEKKEIYPLANFCFLNNADNQKIKDKAPSDYMSLMNVSSIPEVLKAAICPPDTFEMEYDKFLSARAEMLLSYANMLIN